MGRGALHTFSVDPLDPEPGLLALAERGAALLPGVRAAAAVLVDFDGSAAAWAGTAEPELVTFLSASLGRTWREARLGPAELPPAASDGALWIPLRGRAGRSEVLAGGLLFLGDDRDLPESSPPALVELAAEAATPLLAVLEMRATWFRHGHLSWPGLRRITAHWLESAAIRDHPLWLSLWAIDGLAKVNRERGRRAGDEVMAEAASALAGRLPEQRFFARMPGALFAALSAEEGVGPRVDQVAAETRDRLYAAHGVELRLGVTSSCPSDSSSAEALVNRASVALEAGRRAGVVVQHWSDDLPVEWSGFPDLSDLSGPTYRRFATIWRLFDAFTAGPALHDLLGQTLKAVVPLLGADRACVWMCDNDGSWRWQLGDDEEANERDRIEAAVTAQEPVKSEGGVPTLVVPVPSDSEPLAAFLFAGAALQTGGESISFLVHLADQIGKVLRNRTTLESELRRQREAGARLRRQARELRRMLRTRAGLLGNSPGLREALRRIERAAATSVPVLIAGETGTGKEVAARMIHRQSKRDGPFVVVDCGAIPGPLLESELFGHEEGAFTGAKGRKIGRFEQARGGTLFLDEIGELPLELQPKLLRVLQESTIRRVGGAEEIRLDFRAVAATHRDLETMVREGRFREDLFFRLRVIEVGIPPLRDRGDDILLLAHTFLRDYSSELDRDRLALGAEAERRLVEHRWPGNVRELQNVLRRAAVMAPGPELSAEDLLLGTEAPAPPQAVEPPPSPPRRETSDEPRSQPAGDLELEDLVCNWLWDSWAREETATSPLDAVQSYLMRALLGAAGGNLSRLAELLGASAATAKARLRRLSHPKLTRSLRAHPLAAELDRCVAELTSPGSGEKLLGDLERVLLRELFVYFNGNKTRMARALGWSRQTISSRLDRAKQTT